MKTVSRKVVGHLFWQSQIAVAIALIVYMLFTRSDASLPHYLTSVAGIRGSVAGIRP